MDIVGQIHFRALCGFIQEGFPVLYLMGGLPFRICMRSSTSETSTFILYIYLDLVGGFKRINPLSILFGMTIQLTAIIYNVWKQQLETVKKQGTTDYLLISWGCVGRVVGSFDNPLSQHHLSSRTKDSIPGMALTYALIQMVEKVAEATGSQTDRVSSHCLSSMKAQSCHPRCRTVRG